MAVGYQVVGIHTRIVCDSAHTIGILYKDENIFQL